MFKHTGVALMVVVPLLAGWVVAEHDGVDGAGQPGMDDQALDALIHQWSDQVEGEAGRWSFQVDQTPLMVLSDQAHNRMRIISPIIDARDLDEHELRRMLEANFDRALDARYAVWRGRVWAVYLHPLAELTAQQFHNAVEQVIRLRANYGTTYSSWDLRFGGDG